MISMTGFSRAVGRALDQDVEVEVRSVNHRHLNLRMTLPEALSRFEPEVDKLVRKAVRRGTVAVKVQLHRRAGAAEVGRLKRRALATRRILLELKKALGDPSPLKLETLLSVPGFWLGAEETGGDPEELWAAVEPVVSKALEGLAKARAREGKATRADLARLLARIEELSAEIQKRAPQVVQAYQERLQGRVEAVLKDHGLPAAGVELAREIGIFADRCDVSEEIGRLQFHHRKMKETLDSSEPVGRTLEFMAQEMTREANTTAAKANDAGISALAVQIKGDVERIKEQSENVE